MRTSVLRVALLALIAAIDQYAACVSGHVVPLPQGAEEVRLYRAARLDLYGDQLACVLQQKIDLQAFTISPKMEFDRRAMVPSLFAQLGDHHVLEQCTSEGVKRQRVGIADAEERAG